MNDSELLNQRIQQAWEKRKAKGKLFGHANHLGNRYAKENPDRDKLGTIKTYQDGFMAGIQWLIATQFCEAENADSESK